MLIYKGYNVYPTQLEEVLAAHPGVAQVAVIGAPHPDAGEVPVAYVVLRPGAEASVAELLDFVAARVAPYQRVRELHFLPALPVSAAGKILKTELRALRAGGQERGD
jgi:long-chain acyl-CoA synthetase